MTVALVFLMCWAALGAARSTPLGGLLHRIMVELPAEAANRCSRGHAALAIVVLMLIALQMSVGDNDPVRMVGLAAPDLALWLTSLELGTIIEAAAFVAATWAAARGVNVSSVFGSVAARLVNRSRTNTNRARRSRRRDGTPPANDDEDGPAVALAS